VVGGAAADVYAQDDSGRGHGRHTVAAGQFTDHPRQCGATYQRQFFTADLDAVRAAFESVPWVRKAMVRREWPNKLIVTVEEHRGIGHLG